jgi:hypothetical protein
VPRLRFIGYAKSNNSNEDFQMKNLMASNQTSIVVIYGSRRQAESAVRELQSSDFDMKNLSIVVKDYRTVENIYGDGDLGDRTMSSEFQDIISNDLWNTLFGSWFFMVPGIGPLLVAGPLVAEISDELEDAALESGYSTLGAALLSIGIPKDSIMLYEENVKDGKLLLVLHGTPWEVELARERLNNTRAEKTVHSEPVAAYVELHK